MEDRNIEDTRQPPDEPEAQFCEDCGEEMEEDKWGDWMKHYMKCNNIYCPGKFWKETRAYDMAVKIVELKDDLERAKRQLRMTRSQHE